MNRVAKDTFAKLCADVSSGDQIPNFYFSFLGSTQLDQLLSLAAKNGNAMFYAQVKSLVKKSAAKNSVELRRKQLEVEKRTSKKKRKRAKRMVQVSPKEKGIVRERNMAFGGRSGGVVSHH